MCGGYPGCCCNNCNFDDHFNNGKVNCRFKRFYRLETDFVDSPLCNEQYTETGTLVSRDYTDNLPDRGAGVVRRHDLGLCFKYPTFSTWEMIFEATLGTAHQPRITVLSTVDPSEITYGDPVELGVFTDLFFIRIRTDVNGADPNRYTITAQPSGTTNLPTVDIATPTLSGFITAASNDVVTQTIRKVAADSYTYELKINGVVPKRGSPPFADISSTFQLTGRTSDPYPHGRNFFYNETRTLNRMRIACSEYTVEPDPEPEPL